MLVVELWFDGFNVGTERRSLWGRRALSANRYSAVEVETNRCCFAPVAFGPGRVHACVVRKAIAGLLIAFEYATERRMNPLSLLCHGACRMPLFVHVRLCSNLNIDLVEIMQTQMQCSHVGYNLFCALLCVVLRSGCRDMMATKRTNVCRT